MIITQQEYDELYNQVKQEVIKDMKQTSNLPYKDDHLKLVQKIEDQLWQYSEDSYRMHHTKSGVYEVMKAALDIRRMDELKRIGTEEAEQFTDELFALIENYRAGKL